MPRTRKNLEDKIIDRRRFFEFCLGAVGGMAVSGACSIPGTHIPIPDASDIIPFLPEDREPGDAPPVTGYSTTQQVSAIQSGFVSHSQIHGDLVYAKDSRYKDILRLSPWHPSYGSFSTLIEFSGLERYKESVLKKAEIILTISTDPEIQDDITRPIRSGFGIIRASWDENTLSYSNNPYYYGANGAPYFLYQEKQPDEKVVLDITEVESDWLIEGTYTPKHVVEYWINHPQDNHGLVLWPLYSEGGSDYGYGGRTFYSTRAEDPEKRPKLKLTIEEKGIQLKER